MESLLDPCVPNPFRRVEARRFPENPIITKPGALPAGQVRVAGKYLNGPAPMAVPEWLPNPRGKFYLYFGDHAGRKIHLAYADAPEGPWRYCPEAGLRLEDVSVVSGHIASPEIFVDHEKRKIHLIFHGVGRSGQLSAAALSDDGLFFTAGEIILGKFYMRVFQWHDRFYAYAKDWNRGWGELSCSDAVDRPYTRLSRFIRRARHAALLVKDGRLLIFHSRIADRPERILMSTVDLDGDWRSWKLSEALEVIRPESDFEGAAFPVGESVAGAGGDLHQLRDPGILENGGRIYLYYSFAGENGIAGAELVLHE